MTRTLSMGKHGLHNEYNSIIHFTEQHRCYQDALWMLLNILKISTRAMRSLPSLRHLLPYKDPLILPHPQEREARSILDKYAFAADYLSGIGLNPNDIIDSNLADQYSPT